MGSAAQLETSVGIYKTRIRTDIDPLALAAELDASPRDNHQTVSYHCTLVTPMFGGGVEAGVVDTGMPIRATAIRGQLRFWWRLLNGTREDGSARPSKDLFELERQIWGGLGDEKTLAKSSVRVVVAMQSIAQLKPAASYPPGKSFPRWDNNDEAYVLFPAADVSKGPSQQKQAAELLQAGSTFQVNLVRTSGMSDSQWSSVLDAFRWWANFGGLGARTRRGLGAVEVRKDGAELTCPDDAEIAKVGCLLATGRTSDSPIASWRSAVGKLRQFRQEPDVGRNPGSAQPNRPGRTRWPEADAIRTVMGAGAPQHPVEHPAGKAFPRAMFGLPIITHFKDSQEPRDSSLQPVPAGATDAAERMASPLILRPVKVAPGNWAAGALLLPRDHVDRMGLVLTGSKTERMNPGTWWKPELAQHVRPMAALADDPLEAFMRGFSKDQWPSVKAAKTSEVELVEVTYERPTLMRSSNGSIEIAPADRSRKVTLLADEANKCLAALSEYATKDRLLVRKPFNRLSLTLKGDKFVRLLEYKE